jgi:hypothetical protein
MVQNYYDNECMEKILLIFIASKEVIIFHTYIVFKRINI